MIILLAVAVAAARAYADGWVSEPEWTAYAYGVLALISTGFYVTALLLIIGLWGGRGTERTHR